MNVADIQAKSECWNVRLIGHHDLNGHGDGMQLLKNGRLHCSSRNFADGAKHRGCG
jgi:hypothetical protein